MYKSTLTSMTEKRSKSERVRGRTTIQIHDVTSSKFEEGTQLFGLDLLEKGLSC